VGRCSALTNLNLAKCAGATDATLAAIARSWWAVGSGPCPLTPSLPRAPTLALTSPRLSVLDLKDSDECTDAGLIAVAGGCAKLQALARSIGRSMDG
jgi:hypothetical protein